MARISKKVCIIGDFAVGKTSTVARFVNRIFSDQHPTTVGVRIDTKDMVLEDGRQLRLVIWDIAGSERFSSAELSRLRGAEAYILVADGTRRETMKNALALRAAVEARFGELPFVLLVNKSDLQDDWEIPAGQIESLQAEGLEVICTSAKTGECVDKAFDALAKALTGVD